MMKYNLSYVISVMNRVTLVCYHTVDFGGTSLDIANQKRSLETFKKNCHVFPDEPMNVWYRVRESSEQMSYRSEKLQRLEYQIPSVAYFKEEDEPTVPSFRHNSLWAFYDAVGYDHKRQQFK